VPSVISEVFLVQDNRTFVIEEHVFICCTYTIANITAVLVSFGGTSIESQLGSIREETSSNLLDTSRVPRE
jgi:hypothetical protein